jgi:hypothetical protein
MASGGLLHDSLTNFNISTNCNVVVECGPRHTTLLGLILNPTATALVTIGGMPIVSAVILLTHCCSRVFKSRTSDTVMSGFYPRICVPRDLTNSIY